MFEKVKKFIKNEEGYTAESLSWTTVLGVGAATIGLGIYAAARIAGANIIADLSAIKTASSMPTVGEQLAGTAGQTGAVIELQTAGQ